MSTYRDNAMDRAGELPMEKKMDEGMSKPLANLSGAAVRGEPAAKLSAADAVHVLRLALVQAECAIKGREHTGFITRALEATTGQFNDSMPGSSSDWRIYHSALSKCADLLDNMADNDALIDTPIYLAAKLSARAADAPSEPSDLSRKLRDAATADVGIGMAKLLIGAAEEVERYYGGMMAWKKTAEKKDRDWQAERMGRVDDRIKSRAADTLDSQPTDLLTARAEGRAEVVQMILGMDAETPLSEFTGWGSSGAPDDEGSAYWMADALRAHFSCDNKLFDMHARAEEMYWEALGKSDEADRMSRMLKNAETYQPLHDFLAKHEAWDLLHSLIASSQPTDGEVRNG